MVPVEQDVLGLQVHMYHLCASKESDKQAVRQMILEHASTRYVYLNNNDNNENAFQLMMS